VCEYSVGENQQFNFSLVLDKNNKTHDMHIRFYVAANASLTAEILIAHTSVNVIVDCVLQGEGADARIRGAYIGSLLDKIHIKSSQQHHIARTSSSLIMRGALYDSAQAQYYGTIRVEKGAQGSNSSQENKNMLLSNNARALSVPNLEVLTNDVKCFHGSAVGRFDNEQLFYTASRGIDEKTAQRLLLNAFFAEIFVSDELNKRLVNEYI
jgi:Fe-S cluster assembly scaffold protein SufB